jgi:hypothetical protein
VTQCRKQEKAIEIAKTIYQIETNIDNQNIKHIILLTEKQKYLAELFDFG